MQRLFPLRADLHMDQQLLHRRRVQVIADEIATDQENDSVGVVHDEFGPPLLHERGNDAVADFAGRFADALCKGFTGELHVK